MDPKTLRKKRSVKETRAERDVRLYDQGHAAAIRENEQAIHIGQAILDVLDQRLQELD